MRGAPGREILQRHGLAILILIAAVALRFHRLVFEGVVRLNDEMADEYYPAAANIFTRIRHGTFPLWSPEILFGYPVSLTVDLHVFSPFGWPFLLWPAHVAVALQMLSVQLCAAFCMYALARRLQMSATAGAAAAILWISGGAADNMLLVSMDLATLPWIPLVVLCWDHYGRSGDPRWAAVSGGTLGLAILGGHVQFVYWTLVFLLAYLVFVLRPLGNWRRDGWRAAQGAAVMCLVATAIAAAMVLPTTELLRDSIRASLEPNQRVHTGFLSLAESWRALRWTVFNGRDPENTLVEGDVGLRTAGMLPVALALLAWGRGRRLDNRLLVLAAAFLALSLGAVFAPANWLVKVLPLNNFRYPVRIALFFTLVIVLLAARGVDRLLAGGARRLPNVLAIAALAVLCTPGIRDLLHSDRVSDASEGRLDVACFLLLGLCLALRTVGWPWTVVRRCAVLGALCWFVAHAQVMNDVAPAWVTVRAWGESAGAWDHREGHDEHYPPSHLLRVPQRDEHGPTRMLQLDAPWEHDLSLLTGHHTPAGLMSLRPGRVDRLVYARHVASDPEASLDQTLLSRRTLLDLFNVQYLVIDAARFEDHFGSPETNDSLIQGQRLGRFTLVENRTHLPRSFFVTHASYVQSAEQARARITSASFEPRREIVLETNGGPTPPNLGEPRFQPATVTAYENERVQVEVAAPREGWVVLLDRWAPGWSARLDGQRVPVLRADYLFRAVRVPAGRHHLVFAYDNALFRWGLRASAVGLTVVLAAAVSLLRARRR